MAQFPVHPVAVQDVQAWLVIKWASLLGLDLPNWLIQILESNFPAADNEGITIDLTSATIDFGLNEIPNAVCSVAVGFNMRNPRLVSAIHYLTRKLKLFLAASIWVYIRRTHILGNAFYTNQWPKTTFRIFDGYIIGSTFHKTTTGIDFQLQLTHWLSNLSFSSVLSRSSSPQNPGQISFDPSLPDVPNAGARTVGGFIHGAYMTTLAGLINAPVINRDLWNNTSVVSTSTIPPDIPGNTTNLFVEGTGGMKRWLSDLCKQDRINWRQFQTGMCDGTIPESGAVKNVEALSAIRRIEPLSTGYVDGVPLAIKQEFGYSNMADQMAAALSFQVPVALANSTMWDKLVGEFGAEMQFAIVPQVEKALVVPFNPGLRTPWTTINASEYDFIERSDHIPRPLRGVGMFVGREFSSGGGTSLNKHPIYTVGAYYENPNRRNGMVVWKQLPRWLATVVFPHRYLAGGSDVIVTTGINPITNTADPNTEPAPAQKIEDSKPVWCQYARALYIQEILRGRSGRLSGRMRFDIAPGSIIKVEVPEEPFVLERMGMSRSYIHAQAIRVSTVINSEAQKCGTAIQFAFVREEDENKDDSYSVESHPIWKNNWSGAPLVNHKEFYYGTLKDT